MAALLDALDHEQAAAAMAVAGPVCIIAGAGTGKTRTITYRLAHGVESGVVVPSRALAVTHSRKAAAELRDRLNGLGVRGVDTCTFHAAGLRVVSRNWSRTGRPGLGPSVLSEMDAWWLWRASLRTVTPVNPDNNAIRDVVDEVGWARARLIAPELYPNAAAGAGRHPGVDLATVVSCWDAYSRLKQRQGRVDFADLLELAADLIQSDEYIAEGVRARWSHVTVDEYQDVDPAQQRLLEAIVGEQNDLCVVGDPRQAIYSWKGAEPGYLTDFTRRYPGTRVFDLTRNYRSSPEIVAWANRVASGPATKPLVATRPPGPAPKITRTEDEAREAAWVAEAIRRRVAQGVPPGEIAVLYRFNATQARFEAAIAGAGIDTVVAEDTPFFERTEITEVLVPFGQAARAQPDVKGLQLLDSFLERAGFDKNRPPEGLGAARARWESHRALLELLETGPNSATATADELLAQINAVAKNTNEPRNTGVTLATLHKAKGLEWDVVFLVGMNDGAMPSSFAKTTEERAEEERLLHVGVSRARHELHLTWPATNPRGRDNRSSPFLDLLSSRQQLAGRGSKARATQRTGSKREQSARRESKARETQRTGISPSSASCAHCAAPLKGTSARRLGICPLCLTRAPGELGKRARAVTEVIHQAAIATRQMEELLVSGPGLARLLEQRPSTGKEVTATPGVRLQGGWAQAAADALKG